VLYNVIVACVRLVVVSVDWIGCGFFGCCVVLLMLIIYIFGLLWLLCVSCSGWILYSGVVSGIYYLVSLLLLSMMFLFLATVFLLDLLVLCYSVYLVLMLSCLGFVCC